VRRSPINPLVFGLAIGLALVVPIIAFALFTRATIESDISLRLRQDREATARLAAAMVRQRFDSATADLARFAGRPDIADAARRKDAQALAGLLAEFSDPHQFHLVGVIDANGKVVAHVPEGPVDPTFASDVAENVLGSPVRGLTGFMVPDARAPFTFGSVGAVVMALDTGVERLAVYGMLSFVYFRSVLLPVTLTPGQSMVLLDETGRVIVANDGSGDPLFAALSGRDYNYYASDPARGYLGPVFEIPGRQQALASDFGSETLMFDGRERLAIHAAVLPGHWTLYLLDTPAIALAGERRLTEQVTVGAAMAGAVATVLALVLAWLVNRLRQQQRALARLAISEERLRFARDLHDLLGRGLSLIAIKSELAMRLVSGNAAAAKEIDDVEHIAREALRDVREAVDGYRQPHLATELAGARSALAAAGIDCHVERLGGELPDQIDALFAWAVREGVTNVIRHSGAGRCDIRVTWGQQDAQVEVTDDGAAEAPSLPGYGLLGLKERAAARGGVAEAGPLPGAGFRLRLAVPVGTTG
jgi:signal transduction histidine kinase